jgi:hypothetical protein
MCLKSKWVSVIFIGLSICVIKKAQLYSGTLFYSWFTIVIIPSVFGHTVTRVYDSV